MIRALLKKQLLELGAAFVRSSKTGKLCPGGYIWLRAAVYSADAAGHAQLWRYGAAYGVNAGATGLDWLYFVLMELSALTVSVLASAFTSYGHLFRCRDNQQLLALPIPPGAILRCAAAGVPDRADLSAAGVVPSVVCYALAAPTPAEPCWRRCR